MHGDIFVWKLNGTGPLRKFTRAPGKYRGNVQHLADTIEQYFGTQPAWIKPGKRTVILRIPWRGLRLQLIGVGQANLPDQVLDIETILDKAA